MKEPVLVSWSGGKDSLLALQEVLRQGLEVAALLTTVTEPYGRVSMHGVRRALLREQASALGLPLEEVTITAHPTNSDYEVKMRAALEAWRGRGVETVVFGDLFLEDVRLYREALCERSSMRAVFPLWGRETAALARAFSEEGYKAVLSCVDTEAIAGSFAGRDFGARLLGDLPAGADPCGENGEFHTFVYAGPLLRRAVSFKRGERVLREGRFMYCDLVPEGSLPKDLLPENEP